MISFDLLGSITNPTLVLRNLLWQPVLFGEGLDATLDYRLWSGTLSGFTGAGLLTTSVPDPGAPDILQDVSISIPATLNPGTWFFAATLSDATPFGTLDWLRGGAPTVVNTFPVVAYSGTALADYHGDDVVNLTAHTPAAANFLGYGYTVEAVSTTIPEPATFLVLGSGLVALGFLRRRKA